MLKKIILCCFVSLCVISTALARPHPSKDEQIADVLNYIKNADPENLSESLRNLANLLKQEKRQSTHYCCAVPSRNETYETRTRVVSYSTVTTSQHIIGYQPCGNGTGLTTPKPPTFFRNTTIIIPTYSPCPNIPIYETVTYLAIKYKVESYTVPVVIVDCPAEHLICCEDYTMVNGQCIATALLGNLQDLINLGIIG